MLNNNVGYPSLTGSLGYSQYRYGNTRFAFAVWTGGLLFVVPVRVPYPNAKTLDLPTTSFKSTDRAGTTCLPVGCSTHACTSTGIVSPVVWSRLFYRRDGMVPPL
jgi:hypothetical protein